MYKLLLVLLLATLCILPQAQDTNVTSGSLVMVRCDNDDDDFLSAPSAIDLAPLLQSFNNRVDTMIFVHGFNVSYSGAKDTFTKNTAILKAELGDRNYVGFYWPSDVAPDFTQAIKNANKTTKYLVYVACEISKWYGNNNRQIHIVSHSLGGRVTLGTLKENDARYVKWGKCFQMASAIDNDSYSTAFVGSNLVPQYTCVYFSTNDWVLKYLYALGESNRDDSRFGGTPEKAAWDTLSLDQRIEYLRMLDNSVERGNLPTNAFDLSLYEAIQRSAQKAMGLNGAILDNPVITKVTNIDMSNVVDGHTYWGNTTVMKNIAARLTGALSVSEEEVFESRTYYATRDQAVANVPTHVSPKSCFVWRDGSASLPWRPIPGTGCAHWVAHQKGITDSPGCYDGYSIRVSQVTSGRTSYSIANARVGDIWTNTDQSHCGIVIAVGNGQAKVRHCSSGSGGVVESWFSTGYSWR